MSRWILLAALALGCRDPGAADREKEREARQDAEARKNCESWVKMHAPGGSFSCMVEDVPLGPRYLVCTVSSPSWDSPKRLLCWGGEDRNGCELDMED